MQKATHDSMVLWLCLMLAAGCADDAGSDELRECRTEGKDSLRGGIREEDEMAATVIRIEDDAGAHILFWQEDMW